MIDIEQTRQSIRECEDLLVDMEMELTRRKFRQRAFLFLCSALGAFTAVLLVWYFGR